MCASRISGRSRVPETDANTPWDNGSVMSHTLDVRPSYQALGPNRRALIHIYIYITLFSLNNNRNFVPAFDSLSLKLFVGSLQVKAPMTHDITASCIRYLLCEKYPFKCCVKCYLTKNMILSIKLSNSTNSPRNILLHVIEIVYWFRSCRRKNGVHGRRKFCDFVRGERNG